jgi:hypothetical protein
MEGQLSKLSGGMGGKKWKLKRMCIIEDFVLQVREPASPPH